MSLDIAEGREDFVGAEPASSRHCYTPLHKLRAIPDEYSFLPIICSSLLPTGHPEGGHIA